MAGTRRSNKAPRVGAPHETEDWFRKNKARQRKRAKAQKAARRRNRKK